MPVETKAEKAAAGSVTIDGNMDIAWNWAKSVSVQKAGETAATFKALWGAGRLHVWVDVFDTTVNGNDAVEIFIDGNNGKTDTYEADDQKYTFRRSGANPHKPAEYKTVNTETGYRIEASIPVDDAAVGKTIGFDVRIEDRSGNAVTKTSWNDIHDGQDTDTFRLSVLTLVEGPRTAKAVNGTPIIDGSIEAA